ncbi:MAG: hypothetical protein ABSH13_21325 [Candidatus Acidiferrum sp.]|jgi:hypothetical protein
MRLRDFVFSTVAFAAGGLLLAAAPGRPQSSTPTPPVVPEPPAMVAAPIAPVFASELAVPAMPAVPATPAGPAAPASPSMEMNLSGGSRSRHHDGPASDCSDLHMRFNDEDPVVDSEERTFSKAEAKVLHVDEMENGGIQLQGWDKDGYSVTACKAADATRGDAKRLLSEIKLSVQGGHVSVSGPSRHNDWNVFLLIRTPRAAEVELTAHNGPVSFFSVDGKITARGVNGPISIEDCSGEADISAVNGPISFSGTGGKLRLHTQNGPISVALNAATWSGGGLVADAVNGPLTLRVPSGFQSSFLVESNGHSPMSCHASICDGARKTWDDEHRRIEYGSGAPLIRLSTENGPISVNTL